MPYKYNKISHLRLEYTLMNPMDARMQVPQVIPFPLSNAADHAGDRFRSQSVKGVIHA